MNTTKQLLKESILLEIEKDQAIENKLNELENKIKQKYYNIIHVLSSFIDNWKYELKDNLIYFSYDWYKYCIKISNDLIFLFSYFKRKKDNKELYDFLQWIRIDNPEYIKEYLDNL